LFYDWSTFQAPALDLLMVDAARFRAAFFNFQVALCFGWLNIRGFAPPLLTVCRIEV